MAEPKEMGAWFEFIGPGCWQWGYGDQEGVAATREAAIAAACAAVDADEMAAMTDVESREQANGAH